jgi:uncharacterized protein (TIGR03000 family)
MYRQRLFGIALAATVAVALFVSPGTSRANFFGWGGYGYGYPYYSYYPGYYGGWGYPYYSYYSYPSYWSYPSYYSYPAYTVVPQTTGYQSFYYAPEAAANQQQDRRVRVEVLAPQDAEVWFDNFKTQQTGTTRLFQSPPVEPNYDYTYDIRAKWMDNGRPVERTRKVTARAGQQVKVDFLQDQNQPRNEKPREAVPAPEKN